MGGEKSRKFHRLCLCQGSPPRGRGKVSCAYVATLADGITPAWAGKRHGRLSYRTSPKDHPRVGGEKMSTAFPASLMIGSPPRGRGKAENAGENRQAHGITPAWAGKRLLVLRLFRLRWDHPRVGGEKRLIMQVCIATGGSPPRGRGKAFKGLFGPLHVRITPAWAGKSFVHLLDYTTFRDHPRVGGEKPLP